MRTWHRGHWPHPIRWAGLLACLLLVFLAACGGPAGDRAGSAASAAHVGQTTPPQMWGSATPNTHLKPATTCCFLPNQAVAWGGDQLDLFGLGADHALWHDYWNGSSWSGWESLGGYLLFVPAAVSWGDNRLDVFVIGGDNHLWHTWWNGPNRGTPANPEGWGGWQELVPSLSNLSASQLSALAYGPNALDVFVADQSGSLYQVDWHGVSWQAYWIAAAPNGPPPFAAVACGTTCAQLFAYYTTPSGFLFNEWDSPNTTTGAWTGPVRWGTPTTPTTSSVLHLSALSVPGGTEVFADANSPYVYATSVDYNNTGWQDLGRAVLFHDPAGAVWGSDQWDVVGVGIGDGAFYHNSHVGGWQGWQSLGSPAGPFSTRAFAASQEIGSLDVFGQAQDDTLWHASGSWDTYSRSWSWGAWESLGHP